MSEKIIKFGLVSIAASVAIGCAALFTNNYLASREVDKADVKSKVHDTFSWKEIGGFYDGSNVLQRIVVKGSYASIDACPVIDTLSFYTPSDREFSNFADILTNAPKSDKK